MHPVHYIALVGEGQFPYMSMKVNSLNGKMEAMWTTLLDIYHACMRARTYTQFDIHGSVHHNTNRIEITNKMRPCSRIYYSNAS
jgi:hypothetical protein